MATSRKRAAPDAAPAVPEKRARTSKAAPKSKAKQVANTSARRTALKGASKAEPKASKAAPKQAAPKLQQNEAPTKRMQFYVFGEGSAGELGLGPKNAANVSTPRMNPNLANIVALATGGMHAAAITADKQLLTWGVNDEKALGRDTNWDGGLKDMKEDSDSDSDDGELNPREAIPTAVPSDTLPAGTEFVQVAAGDSTTFALTTDGYVYGCGIFRDANGQFGFAYDRATNTLIKNQSNARLVPGLKDIKAISAGADFALALDKQGHVFAWGPGQQGQLGRRVVERRRLNALIPSRVEIPKSIKIVSIHAGIDHAFAIDSNGDTWSWGLNNFAQTGIVDQAGEGDAIVVVPRRVESLRNRNMQIIAGGRHHSIGITRAGECLVWGRMDGGQTGLDLKTLSLDDENIVMMDERGKPRILLQPTAVPLPPCIDATAGPDHCIAITKEGKAYSWGFNIGYQCGQGTDDDIEIAKLINGKQVRDIKLCWAGAGGQYSMLASYQEGSTKLPNGTS